MFSKKNNIWWGRAAPMPSRYHVSQRLSTTTHPVQPLILQTDSLTNLPPGWNDGTCGRSHNREGWRIIVWLLSQLCSIFRYIPRTMPTDFLEKMLSGWRKEHFLNFFLNFDGKFLGWSRILAVKWTGWTTAGRRERRKHLIPDSSSSLLFFFLFFLLPSD